VDHAPSRTARPGVEIVLASAGFALVVCALATTQDWLDRHFLPSFFLPRRWYVLIETGVRIGLAIVGLLLALVLRRPIARLATAGPGRAIPVVIAALLAIGAGELVLRTASLRPHGWLIADEEPRRRPDPRLGWTLVPDRVGQNRIGGRPVDYAIDPAGYRVRRLDQPVDPARPTLLFTGESVMFGEGLAWDDSIPAKVGEMLGIQPANLAVHGYGSDQAYLRLQRELPRFRQPTAVISLFMPALFGRNLDQDRPHLGPDLTWMPPEPSSRVLSLAKLLVPFRRERTVDRGVTMTRAVLHATIDLSQSRNATPIILVPQLGPEDELEASLRRRVLDDAQIPYVFVPIGGDWRLPGDVHPNARAARQIAEAIAARLRGR
jgi:hypothetical protein